MESEKMPQDAFQEQLQAKTKKAADLAKSGSKAAHKAALATWEGAKTTAERFVLIGGALGIVSFFLPWYAVHLFIFSASGSGLALANAGKTSYWLFPIMMAAVLLLSWLHLHSDPSKRILNARWYIVVGACWTWEFASTAISSGPGVIAIGGLGAMIAAVLILLGGVFQTKENLAAISNR
jgi:hypothetical protein